MFFQGAYTYSKSIDNNSGSTTQDLGNSNGNQLDTRGVRGLSIFDRTHRLQATYRYEIPAFRHTAGLLHHALGNWEFGGTSTFQSGLPFAITCAACAGNVFGLSTSTLFPEVAGNLNQLRLPGNPQQFTNSSSYNTGVLGATALNTAGTMASLATGVSITLAERAVRVRLYVMMLTFGRASRGGKAIVACLPQRCLRIN